MRPDPPVPSRQRPCVSLPAQKGRSGPSHPKYDAHPRADPTARAIHQTGGPERDPPRRPRQFDTRVRHAPPLAGPHPHVRGSSW